MKKKTNILIFTFVGFLAILLCLPGIVFSAKSNNPPAGVGDDELVNGRKQGVVIVVFTPDGFGYGSPDAILRMDDQVYFKELGVKQESDFEPPPPGDASFEAWYNEAALAVARIVLPSEISDDFGRTGCSPQILGTSYIDKDGIPVNFTKDVDNLAFKQILLGGGPNYVRVLHCDVTVSFVCPK